jgi:hypothetical protein
VAIGTRLNRRTTKFGGIWVIGLLGQHYTLLRKRSSVVAVARRQIRDGVDIGVSVLHGERYTRFFWNVLVFMMGVVGSPKLYSGKISTY